MNTSSQNLTPIAGSFQVDGHAVAYLLGGSGPIVVITLAGPPPVNFAPDTVDEMSQLLATVLDSPFAQTQEFAAQALAGFKAGGEARQLPEF